MTTTKWTEITVEFAGIYNMKQKETLRYRTEDGKRVYQRRVSKSLDFYYGSVEETIDYLRSEAEGLVDTKIESDYEYGYYGDRDRDVVILSGWTSDVSEKVIKAAEKAVSEAPARKAAEKAQAKERAKKELERLLAAHPDLLED